MNARHEAMELIRQYLVDDDGLLELPIDPIALAKQMNISVHYSSSLGEGVSGVIVKDETDPYPKIFLAAHEAEVRQKFTCAHEIGHYVQRMKEDDIKFGFVDSRDDLSSTGMDTSERQANSFAAELLMPAVAVRKFFADGMRVSKLAREFGVSEQAMTFRLRNLYLA